MYANWKGKKDYFSKRRITHDVSQEIICRRQKDYILISSEPWEVDQSQQADRLACPMQDFEIIVLTSNNTRVMRNVHFLRTMRPKFKSDAILRRSYLTREHTPYLAKLNKSVRPRSDYRNSFVTWWSVTFVSLISNNTMLMNSSYNTIRQESPLWACDRSLIEKSFKSFYTCKQDYVND